MTAPRPSSPAAPLLADDAPSSQEKVAVSSDASEAPDTDAPTVLQDAWEAVQPAAEALPPESLVRPNVPVREAALLGRRVADALHHDDAARKDFEALGATPYFSVAHFHALPRYARALLYVRAHVDTDVAPSASVPTALVEQAKSLQARMLKVLGFYFDEETPEGAELARIRGATSHAGIAGGLVSLGTLYTKHQARIQRTPEFYAARDARDAAATAEEIFRHLATPTAPSERWSERQARVWTLFVQAYTEVCTAGRFLYRERADLDARFPALASLNVARRGPTKKGDAKKGDTKPEPADPT